MFELILEVHWMEQNTSVLITQEMKQTRITCFLEHKIYKRSDIPGTPNISPGTWFRRPNGQVMRKLYFKMILKSSALFNTFCSEEEII